MGQTPVPFICVNVYYETFIMKLGESDTESVKEMKPNSAARDVAFLQARLQDLMGKLKALKKEKEAVEVNANNARAQHVER